MKKQSNATKANEGLKQNDNYIYLMSILSMMKN